MSTVITQALGAPLDPAFVDRWFDALFLGAAGLTGLTIGVGRRLRGGEGEIRDLEGGGPKES